MKEIHEEKKVGKAKKFFILTFLTAIATAMATLFVKKSARGGSAFGGKQDEDETLGLKEEKTKKKK